MTRRRTGAVNVRVSQLQKRNAQEERVIPEDKKKEGGKKHPKAVSPIAKAEAELCALLTREEEVIAELEAVRSKIGAMRDEFRRLYEIAGGNIMEDRNDGVE